LCSPHPHHPALHSFPTRRSSDLPSRAGAAQGSNGRRRGTRAAPRTTIAVQGARVHNLKNISLEIPRDSLVVVTGLSGSGKSSLRSEEHTSELQSRFDLVCRLLLE